MLMPRLSPGFLTSSTTCGVFQDDGVTRFSPAGCCDDGVVLDGGRSGEMFNGDSGAGRNESSEFCLVTSELATQPHDIMPRPTKLQSPSND